MNANTTNTTAQVAYQNVLRLIDSRCRVYAGDPQTRAAMGELARAVQELQDGLEA